MNSITKEIKIGFLLAYEHSPHAGVVRPFLNWAKWLKEEHSAHPVMFLVSCGKDLVNHAQSLELETHIMDSSNASVKKLTDMELDFLVTDDYIRRLQLVKRIRRYMWNNLKIVVYAQVLYAIHSIAEVFDPNAFSASSKIKLRLSRVISFNYLKRRYVNLLKLADVTISNSNFTSNILQTFYGIDSTIVYPPVDTSTFRPIFSGKENRAILYLGSNAGDLPTLFATKVANLVAEKSELVLLGNHSIAAEIISTHGSATYLHELEDAELAREYSRARIVICPSKWEMFGYVCAEAISCGTPVITWSYGGQSEVAGLAGIEFGAFSENNFLERITEALSREVVSQSQTVDLPFSSKSSTNRLLNILKVPVNVGHANTLDML